MRNIHLSLVILALSAILAGCAFAQQIQKVAVKRADGKIVEVENWLDATPYVSLSDAVAAIGTNEATLLISQMIDVGPRYLEIPPNVTLQFLRWGSLHFNFGGAFEITQWSLKELKKRKLPNAVLTGLKKPTIAGKVFATELQFVSKLKSAIGNDATARYGRLILLYARQIVEINGEVQAGFHQIFQGDGTIIGRVKNERVLPQWFGVAGNGKKDDSDALQKAIDACAATGKTLYFSQDLSIRVTKNLFVYGKFDLLGENTNAEIVLDADLDPEAAKLPPEIRYRFDPESLRLFWINFGMPQKGANPVTYTGTVSNLKFRATNKARVSRMFNFHNAERFTVSGCYFDLREMQALGDIEGEHANNATPIEGQNASQWCPSPSRKHGRLLNNTCIAAQGKWGGEGIGMTNATDIIIEGNYIYGFGDDVIGCFGIEKLTIANNHCYTTDGSIKFTQCRDVRIISNYIERIKYKTLAGKIKWFGGGQLMKSRLESKYLKATSRVIINGNQLYIPAEVPVSTSAIQLHGIRDAIVSNNQIRCDSKIAGKTGGIRIQADTNITDWADPTGLDPLGVARPRNVHITGNTCYGDYPQSIDQGGTGSQLVGPFYVHGNVAGRYNWSHNTNFGLNSVIGAEANPMKISGDVAVSSRLLFEGFYAGIAPKDTVTAVRAGGAMTRFYIEKPTRITYVDVALDQEGVKNGMIDVQLWKNGKNPKDPKDPKNLKTLGSFWPKINKADGSRKRVVSPNTSDYFTCSAGDYIEIKLAGSSNFMPVAGINAVVSVHGISW